MNGYWQDDAECSRPDPETGEPIDPELFFPAPGGRGKARAAKEVCRRCPVVEDCLMFALDRPYLRGVWGGTGERERRKLQGLPVARANALGYPR